MSDAAGENDSQLPEYVIRAEEVLMDWGTSSPLDCMEASDEKPPERRLQILDREIQYHLGAFTAALHTCNSLYKIEGIENRYYPEVNPPWLPEAVERKEDLQQLVGDGDGG